MRFAINRRVAIATAASGVLVFGAAGIAGAALGVGGDDPAPAVETVVDTTAPVVGASDSELDDDADETEGTELDDETEGTEVDDDADEADDDDADEIDDDSDDSELDDDADETEDTEVEDD